MSLRLLSYNIRYGGTGRERALASVVRACEPDVVVLQEATIPEVVTRVAAFSEMPFSAGLRDHSVAYMSRVPVQEARWHRVPFARRHYLELTLEGREPRIYGVHLSAIHSNVTERRRIFEITGVLTSIAARDKSFHAITGDFNTLAPGESLDLGKLPLRLRALTWLTGRKIRWRTIQVMLERGYVDGYRSLHPEGSAYTFPTWDPHVRLDYVFLPKADAGRLKRCEVMRDVARVKEASDHFPLLSEIA